MVGSSTPRAWASRVQRHLQTHGTPGMQQGFALGQEWLNRAGQSLVQSAGDAGYRAVAMDMRGYGGSDHTPHGYDPLTLASDVAGVIRTLGATDALTRMWMQSPFAQMAQFGGFPGFGPGFGGAGGGPPPSSYDAEPPPPAGPPPSAPPPADTGDQLAAMRRELDELKKAMRGEGGGIGKPGAKRKAKREE